MPFRFRRTFRIAPGVRLNIGRRGLFRFRHSFRIAPGIRLNIGKRGLSTSLGGRDAHVTVGSNTRATVSAPGTGLSYTATTHQRSGHVVTVVIWGAQLLGAAVMMALLFLWAAGWLPLQASAPEAEGGHARGAGGRHQGQQERKMSNRIDTSAEAAAAPPANDDRKPVTARKPGKRYADVPDMTPEEHKRRGDGADAMFQEMKRRIAEKARP